MVIEPAIAKAAEGQTILIDPSIWKDPKISEETIGVYVRLLVIHGRGDGSKAFDIGCSKMELNTQYRNAIRRLKERGIITCRRGGLV